MRPTLLQHEPVEATHTFARAARSTPSNPEPTPVDDHGIGYGDLPVNPPKPRPRAAAHGNCRQRRRRNAGGNPMVRVRFDAMAAVPAVDGPVADSGREAPWVRSSQRRGARHGHSSVPPSLASGKTFKLLFGIELDGIECILRHIDQNEVA